jgi:hypothetical protein
MKTMATTEAVSSHPGENGRWESKQSTKHPCSSESPARTGKSSCKSVARAENHKKSPKRFTLFVGQKPNGKSQIEPKIKYENNQNDYLGGGDGLFASPAPRTNSHCQQP